MGDATPSLDDFLTQYRRDDNVWWAVGCGHHMNLFDEACDRAETAEALVRRAREILVEHGIKRDLERGARFVGPAGYALHDIAELFYGSEP